MTTQEIAQKLVAHCRKGAWEAAQKELFAPDAVSVEQQETPGFARETRGLPAIFEKGRKWEAMLEAVHQVTVSEPLVAGDAIALTITMDLTMKGRGRTKISEIAVYEVENGKITAERFFS
jgi:limonene-1,2-epoxide hydrolase